MPYLIILLGVLSVSGASILFQYATAEPLVVAMYRLAFSVLLLGIPLTRGKAEARMSRTDMGLSLLSGLFLALHFGTWFFSLKLTSVASSTVLVSMHPFMVLLYGYFAWGERTRGRALAGVVLAVLGAVLVSWGDFQVSGSALLGDLLAFLGAVAMSGYFLIGRYVRQRAGVVAYSTTTYGAAAAVLLVASLAWGNPLTGFEAVNWWIFVALAVFPTIFGHTLFNWALKFVPASVVSVSVLGEPVGASILAWALWRAVPGPLTLVGGTLILIGIGLFQWRRETT